MASAGERESQGFEPRMSEATASHTNPYKFSRAILGHRQALPTSQKREPERPLQRPLSSLPSLTVTLGSAPLGGHCD